MEIIHVYHGTYPFGKQKQAETTFMEEIKHNLNEEEISLLRQKSKIYRSITSPHFIKLAKFLKEDSNIYLVYEYEQTSLQSFIDSLKKNGETSISRDKFKTLASDFKGNIDNIIQALVRAEIKADIFLSNLAYCSKIQKDGPFVLKLFIDSQAEYLSLIQHKYRSKQSKKKDKQGINQQFLNQFYQAEKKRLIIQFQELVQKIIGKIIDTIQRKQSPNFIINGTKLVFIHEEKEKQPVAQHPQKMIKSQHILTLQQKQKNQTVRIQTIKKQQQTEKPHVFHTNVQKQKPTSEKQVTQNSQKQKKAIQGPIVDFDQSFEPQFKPEEFIKEKTYIYQQKQYLDCLQEQLQKIATEKYLESKKSNSSQAEKIKEQKKFSNNHAYDKVKIQHKVEQAVEQKQKKQPKQIDLTISKGSNCNNNNNNSTNLSNGNISSNNDSYEKKQVKIEKLNKYKMKIITSHEIEIEGGGDETNVQEIQKQIIKGIRSGKLNINQLSTNNQKINIPCKQQGGDLGDSLTNTVNNKSNSREEVHNKSNSREQINNQSNSREQNEGRQNSKKEIFEKQYPEDNYAKHNYQDDNRAKINSKEDNYNKINSKQDFSQQQRIAYQRDRHQIMEKSKQTVEQQENRQIARQKQISSNKIKSINQIIQKIGLKANINIASNQPENKNNQKNEVKQYQHSPSFIQAGTVSHNKLQKLEKVQKVQKIEKNEKVDIVEKPEKTELYNPNEDKNEKAENYMTKIRQAKNKAELILRQYTKKKQ